MIHFILLSGGSGSRLWPLSNGSRSKQFLKVLRDEQDRPQSMVQRTFERISALPHADRFSLTVATCAEQVDVLKQQIDSASFNLVVEPERRDTAPAIMLSCAYLAFKRQVLLEDTVIVMPIDTYASTEYYDSLMLLDRAVQDGDKSLMLLGADPVFPSSKYGYMVPSGNSHSEIKDIERFIEKPNEQDASELIRQGALWNCGVFAFRLHYLMNILSRYYSGTDYEELLSSYSILPKNSFDYEVVERESSIGAVSYHGEWKDLGTWNTLTEEMRDTASGNVVLQEETSPNTHVVNELDIPMVVAGVRDSVVIATPDGILVSSKAQSAVLKPLVSIAAVSRPMYEQLSWGSYRVVERKPLANGTVLNTSEVSIRKGCSYSIAHALCGSLLVAEGKGEIRLATREPISISAGGVFDLSGVGNIVVSAIDDMLLIVSECCSE